MAKIRDGAVYLAGHLCANDYHAAGEQVVGLWQGRFAARLGLEGKTIVAGDKAFEFLRRNINPSTRGRLTPRNVAGSVRFFDFQCSSQKSLSVLYALTGDTRLAGAHDHAAATAFRELEAFAACRVRAGAAAWSDENNRTGNVCAATFRHDASRALDPQLHTHHVIANVTWDESKGRAVALTEREMVGAIRYVGKVYQSGLAREVQALGYLVEIRRDGRGVVEGFEVAGVPQALCERFSKRRAEIEVGIHRFIADRGREPSPAEIGVITRATRGGKLAETSTLAVRATQMAAVSPDEHTHLYALRDAALARAAVASDPLTGDLPPFLPPSFERERVALTAAVTHGYKVASVLPGHRILADALNADLGGLNLPALKSQMLAGVAGLLALDGGEDDPQPSPTAGNAPFCHFATREGLALEHWSVHFVNRGQGHYPALLRKGDALPNDLDEAQCTATRAVGASRDQVFAVRGPGADLVPFLTALDARLTAAGHRLLHLVPSAGAAEDRRAAGIPFVTTVSEYLDRASESDGQRTPAAWHRAVVLVDETALSNQLGAAILRVAAEREGGRVILVGDSREHVAGDACDFVRVLEAHSRLVVTGLEGEGQQAKNDHHTATRLLACGEAAAGLDVLDELGLIHEVLEGHLLAAANEYLRLETGVVDKNESVAKEIPEVTAVAPTREETHVLTDHIRAGLRATGKLGTAETRVTVHEPLSWTVRQRQDAKRYLPGHVVSFQRDVAGFRRGEILAVDDIANDRVVLLGGRVLNTAKASYFTVAASREIALAAGDRILLRADDRRAKLTCGRILTVRGVNADGSIVTSEGESVPATYRQFSHAYASAETLGRFANHVVVAAATLTAKSAYLACSRGRRSCVIYTPDRARLLTSLPRSGQHGTNLELLRARAHQQRQRAADRHTFVRARTAIFAALSSPPSDAATSPAPEASPQDRTPAQRVRRARAQRSSDHSDRDGDSWDDDHQTSRARQTGRSGGRISR